MEKTIQLWLLRRQRVSLQDVRRELGKDSMDIFISNHEDWGFYFCEECNQYAKTEVYDSTNAMCADCRKEIEDYKREERFLDDDDDDV